MRRYVPKPAGSVLIAAAIGTVIWVNAGSLTPPGGPVAPTMKTLVEVEPRISVQSLSGSGSALHVISQSGSYYLTGNLLGSSGLNGIEIQADDVALDLSGMAVAGVPGSLDGIKVTAAVRNLDITNGTVAGWGGNGINAISASDNQISRVRVGDNLQGGLLAGEHASVREVTSSGNSGSGIVAGAASIVRECTASGNGQHGITADTGSLVTACASMGNNGDGVRVSEGTQVIGVVARGNGGGIHATGDLNRIEENHVTDSSGQGIAIDGTGNLVVRNNVRASSGLNYSIAANNDYATILLAPGSSFSTSEAWANFGDGCPPGLTLCGGNCVDLTSNPNHCGTCGAVCSSGAPNTSALCSNGACTVVCSPNYADCNSNMGDGCEVYLPADPNHCGACNTVCPPVPNATNNCTNGACTIQCNPGFGNCDNNPINGCEANLSNDVANCGNCGLVCPPKPNAFAVCNAGACSFVCNSGFANCNGNPNDGCEVNTQTDDNNCGNCGNTCSQFFTCVNGTCQ